MTSVSRLIVVVEGKTEDNFVRRSIQPHFQNLGIFVAPTIVGKAKAASRGNSGKGKRGGGRYADWKKDIQICLKNNPGHDFRLTTLFDLYGLPVDFPDRERKAADKSAAHQCDRLMQVLSDEIDDWRFIPYLQLHEFEALVMACLPNLEAIYDTEEQLAGLANLRAEVHSVPPEEINNSKITAPSKRLLRHIPGYSKQQDGPDVIELSGLNHVRYQCHRFNSWLSHLESLKHTDANE